MNSVYEKKLKEISSQRLANRKLIEEKVIRKQDRGAHFGRLIPLYTVYYGCGFAKGFLDASGIDISEISDKALLYGPSAFGGLRSLYNGTKMAGAMEIERKNDSELENDLEKAMMTKGTDAKIIIGMTAFGVLFSASTTAIGYTTGYGLGYILHK